MEHIYVEKWIPYSEVDKYQECEFDNMHENALIKELVENNYIICGDTHQCSDFYAVPVFNDGCLVLSMRRWQEIMKEAYKLKNPFKSIPNFYMASLCDIKERLP